MSSEHNHKPILIATTDAIVGHKVKKIFGYVSGASSREIYVGGNTSNNIEIILEDIRKAAFEEIRRNALTMGANAVVGLNMICNEFSHGGEKKLHETVYYGTAMAVEQAKSYSPFPFKNAGFRD